MAGEVARRAGGLLVVLLAVVVGACNADASSSRTAGAKAGGAGGGGRQSAPVRDTFAGSIVSGTGAYAGSQGRVKVYLHPRGSGTDRPVRVVIQGRCAAAGRHCTELTGSMTGMLSRAGHGLPDVGNSFTLTGTGRVSPLGHTTGHGSVSGTGFIALGHELMTLRLTTRRGSVTLRALSGRVKGFTSP